MKTAVVYYSLTGNTAWAAERLAERLEADRIALRPCKAYPDRGIRKFLRGGRSAVMGEAPPLEPYSFDAAQYDCVVLAGPLWAGRIAPPLRSFLREHGAALAGRQAGAVICCGGGKDDRAFSQLRELLDRQTLPTLRLVDPKDRPSPENARKMDEFCLALRPAPVQKEGTA